MTEQEAHASAAAMLMGYGKLLRHMSQHLIFLSSEAPADSSAAIGAATCATLLGVIGKHMCKADLASLARLAAAMQRQERARIGNGDLSDADKFLREVLPVSAAALDQIATDLDKASA